MKNWSKIIKSFRVDHNLTQAQMAERLGVDHTSISRWELKQDKPSKANIRKLNNRILDPLDGHGILRSIIKNHPHSCMLLNRDHVFYEVSDAGLINSPNTRDHYLNRKADLVRITNYYPNAAPFFIKKFCDKFNKDLVRSFTCLIDDVEISYHRSPIAGYSDLHFIEVRERKDGKINLITKAEYM
jgi:transcriptional regulator with XRE-family HTH domain